MDQDRPVHPDTAQEEATKATREIPQGEVRLLPADERKRLHGALDAARLLVVPLEELGPGARGRLAERIDDAIETTLRNRGAASPGITTASDADAILSDQLYRTRRLGKLGLALDLGTLVGLTDARGALEPDDGATLRFFAQTTQERPLVLLLDAADATVRMYGAPVPLPEALPLGRPLARAKVAPKPVRVGQAKAPPAVASVSNVRIITPVPPLATEPEAPAPEPRSRLAPPPRIYVSIGRADDEPLRLLRALALLEDTGRTTPLAALERAFLDGYAPLRSATIAGQLAAFGVPRDRAEAALAQFARTFSRTYAEALPTFANTGRHPRMVFELFDLAHRSARMHGARAVQIVLVDALRFDLGQRLRQRLGHALSRQAVCVEEQLLWSVLPTTTATQLDALIRGEDALRAPKPVDRETSIVRGRSLDVLRRTRLGHRDVVKLDVLEGRLRDAGASEDTRLDALASEVSPLLERFIRTSSPRTLVVVAGDHGFTFAAEPFEPVDPRRETPAARQGGASPDEVFVPLQAWLVGGVH